ncbi:MAG TPA: S41 family peptidase [Gemmatimonadales bacterium]|nr:S41 family peptidase [Gemmatimonadales bacterium]
MVTTRSSKRRWRRAEILLAALAAAGCGASTGPDNREDQFDQLWESFDHTYPYFSYKQIDWNAARATYRDAAIRAGTMEGFVLVVGQMLEPLRDAHVYIESRGGARTPTYVPQAQVNWDVTTWEQYLIRNDWAQLTGWGWGRWGDVGYIAISAWTEDRLTAADFDRALESLRDTRELIFDVRMNPGGNDQLAFAVAARFADQARITGYTRVRNGAGHDDFTAPTPRNLSPRGPWQYTRPVTLLMGRGSFSSNESFIAAMGEFPHVTLVGDTTGGASGNPVRLEMGEGWHYTVSTWIETTVAGRIIEWNGIAPDIVVPWSPQVMAAGTDQTLEFAIARTGATANLRH